ncbi:MAG: ankyrin repeat domain-containing protein [Bacteroidota bacterium]
MNRIVFIIICLFFHVNLFSQETEDKNVKLLIAAESGNETEVLRLIKEKADVNTTNEDGVTPLMYAAQNGYLDIVKIILFNGAKIDAKPVNGINALISAAIYDKKDVVEYLLQEGADVNAKDNDNISSLLYATVYGNIDMVSLLFFYGADIYTNASDGVNPLIAASFYGYDNIVDLLINRGVKTNTTDFFDWTPLMVAVQNNFLSVAEKLLKNGADVNKVNSAGYSALAIATQNSNKEAIDLLLKYNASINIKTSDSLSLSDIAYKTGQRKIAVFYKKKGLKSSYSPAISIWEFSPASMSFNATDYMLGAELLMKDLKNNLSFFGGFQTRLYANRVLLKIDEQNYLQRWERRQFAYFGLGKNITLKQFENVNIDIFPFLKYNYTAGSYRASVESPSSKLYLVPGISISANGNYVFAKLGYEYNNLKINEFNPHRIVLSLGFRFKSKYIKSKKTINWI